MAGLLLAWAGPCIKTTKNPNKLIIYATGSILLVLGFSWSATCATPNSKKLNGPNLLQASKSKILPDCGFDAFSVRKLKSALSAREVLFLHRL